MQRHRYIHMFTCLGTKRVYNALSRSGKGTGIGRGVAMGHAPIQNTCTQLLDPAEAQASVNAPV